MKAKVKDKSIYHAIERLLKATDHPLTSVDMFDMSDIKAHAADVNEVSDTLGYMWRKGYLTRQAAPKTPLNQSKWAYSWGSIPDKPTGSPMSIADLKMLRPHISISEKNGSVTLSFPEFTITIQGNK